MRLGTNAVLAVSVAAAVAAANALGVPLFRRFAQGRGPLLLPLPMINILSGGAHAGGVMDVQDLLVVPVGASCLSDAVEWAWRIRREAVRLALDRGLPGNLTADEGGLGLSLGARSALELLMSAIEGSGLRPGDDVSIAIDVAAGQLASKKGYKLKVEGATLDTEAMIDQFEQWCGSFPIVSLEDPLSEDDWEGWAEITRRLGSTIQIVGDDLFASNVTRLDRGIATGAANTVLIKPNQTGTLSDAWSSLVKARSAGYSTILSARSGDTEDHWLSDLAVGWSADQIKVGSVTRSERTSKWNRLLRLEQEYNHELVFARWHLPSSADKGRRETRSSD